MHNPVINLSKINEKTNNTGNAWRYKQCYNFNSSANESWYCLL